jgi:hypothetical protein
MLPGRVTGGNVGRTRTCPHCKATILESAAVCPQCRHHLKFGAAAQPQKQEGFSALRVQGELKHPQQGSDWEYSVVMTIRNERGEEISRQVVGVGALRQGESRTFTLSVDVVAPGGGRPR